MRNPVFKEKQSVVCKGTSGYRFTLGKTYKVLEYIEPLGTGHFTFPAYVKVEDDDGQVVHAHARRFRPEGE